MAYSITSNIRIYQIIRKNTFSADLCNKWVHIYCNNICKKTYQKLKKDTNSWLCILWLRMKVPFPDINNTEFSRLLNWKSIIPQKEWKATAAIFEKLKLFTGNENKSCKYYSNKQFKKLKKDNEDKNISLLHLNIYIDNLI